MKDPEDEEIDINTNTINNSTTNNTSNSFKYSQWILSFDIDNYKEQINHLKLLPHIQLITSKFGK